MDLPPDSPTAVRRYTCQRKRERGKDVCLTDCAARAHGVFEYARVEAPGDLPPADASVVDVAVLDMNHEWPNLGHDSLVQAVRDAACDLVPVLEPAGLRVRAVSFEVRRRHMIPEGPGGRFALYLGTGGPGHLDPRKNDGVSPGSQGIHEDPAWEAPLFALFDAILGSDAALVAVCHSFGVMCRWSGVARPEMRSEAKGGRSAGVMENFLTAEALGHPWFGRLAREMPDRRRVRVVDHRLFDLVPDEERRGDVLPIGYETRGIDGPPGEALTMAEWARDRAGIMPRVFAVNHHPEIVDRGRQVLVLREKLARGEVSEEWARERERIMTDTYPDDARDLRLHLTSDYTLMGPLRFHLVRAVRRRAESLGRPSALHEDAIPAAVPALAAG